VASDSKRSKQNKQKTAEPAAATETETAGEPAAEGGAEAQAPQVQAGGIKRKNLIIIGVIVALAWAFALNTGSTVLIIVVGVLTVLVLGVLVWAYRMIRKQQRMVNLLQGATNADARRQALAALSEGKDANSPTNVFARAQLLAADDPKAALTMIEKVELRTFPPAMQDDVALLKTQLYLGFGRSADARKVADTMNLDNPARKDVRALAASIVAEAWARTGKSKDALALLETIEVPKQNAEQIRVQMRVARTFAKFAGGARLAARNELSALANEDLNLLSRFLAPQFRVHPELQKLARSVLEAHPGARKMAKSQAQRRGPG
jgi:hypothetical protein